MKRRESIKIITTTMESLRVDIRYRPLRIGWAIEAGDLKAFRFAARISFALWGGRFNPMIVVNQEESAGDLVDLFCLDMIFPIGDSDRVKSFPALFQHLINPFHGERLFIGGGDCNASVNVLDMHNALVYLQSERDWDVVKKKGVRLYTWAQDDPLSDVFLMQLGQYPDPSEVSIDYYNLLKEATGAAEVTIGTLSNFPADVWNHPNIAFLNRYGLEPYLRVSRGWDSPGFYYGEASNFDDLVCCWNLRAADIPLLFVDPRYMGRYGDAVDRWDESMRSLVSGRSLEFDRQLAVWTREEALNQEKIRESKTAILKPFGPKVSMICPMRAGSWNGSSVNPPMMHFGEISTLGVVGTESGKTKISFALDEKPFCSDFWFHTQNLVGSISFLGGGYGDEGHILIPPFIPELNEFYARSQHFDYSKLRSEPNSIGLIIAATESSAFVYALSVSNLFEKIFDLVGFDSKLSGGGLIARQLIAQLGGVDGARAFKIPGVRRLLKTHGPTVPFTKKSALQLIGGRDPENPDATFKDYENLYIEPRPPNTKLDPDAVFTYLVEKGLFRIGAKLSCPHCQMDSWTSLDILKQRVVCELCGQDFDATRQLVRDTWHYRRSGVLGAEKNAQGAVPVVLTLQQFRVNVGRVFDRSIYLPSVELKANPGLDLPNCEIDFVWLIARPYRQKIAVFIGECKDRGGASSKAEDKGVINEKDIDNLKRVADAFPKNRFEVFLVLAKLSRFTAEEIALARTLNDKYLHRAILLTERELEPYHLYERTKLEFKNIKEYGLTPEDLADNTAKMYFAD